MTPNWIDVNNLSFNTLLLLEREQLAWLPGWLPERELATALKANPVVEWYLRHKNTGIGLWVDAVLPQAISDPSPSEVRACEEAVLNSMNDLVCYAVDPEIYDNQPFLRWDSHELSDLVDFAGKSVVDIGAGTGRLTLVAAENGAAYVFAVEPVSNLRVYLKAKARKNGFHNVYPLDGLITDLPFPDDYLEVVMGGHVFGDHPQAEYDEMLRVVKPGGMLILCPGNNDLDDDRHAFLLDRGFQWARFEEPIDGLKRKYWKVLPERK